MTGFHRKILKDYAKIVNEYDPEFIDSYENLRML